jgi:type IV pilus assembly protein PilC
MFNNLFKKNDNSGKAAGGKVSMALKPDAALKAKLRASHFDKRAKSKAPHTPFYVKLFRRNSVSGKELAVFTRQLAATINAGLLLSEALETIGEESENKYLMDVVSQVRRDIQSGQDFSGALARHPKVFPDEYVSIVRSGEAGGGLAKTLSNLAKYLETSERMKAKIKSAVRYPMFIFGFAIIVVLIMVLFLIPKFKDMFETAGAELPLLTRIVVSISDFMITYFPYILAMFAVLIVAHFVCRKFRAYRYFCDAVKLRLPIIGKEIIHKSVVSRFCHTFGFLLGRGVGLSQSLEITSQAVNNLLLLESIEKIRTKVLSGGSISQQIRSQKLFPNLVSKMASVGEKTGTLASMFEKTGEYYDDELEISVQNLMVMIEPALIVFVGGIVCIVIVALYLPIFKVSALVK